MKNLNYKNKMLRLVFILIFVNSFVIGKADDERNEPFMFIDFRIEFIPYLKENIFYFTEVSIWIIEENDLNTQKPCKQDSFRYDRLFNRFIQKHIWFSSDTISPYYKSNYMTGPIKIFPKGKNGKIISDGDTVFFAITHSYFRSIYTCTTFKQGDTFRFSCFPKFKELR